LVDARYLPSFPKLWYFVWNIRFDCHEPFAHGVQQRIEQHDNDAHAHHADNSAGSALLSIDATGTDYVVTEHQSAARADRYSAAGGLE
jgi:hypothetical protein